jgi:hypothetical protein
MPKATAARGVRGRRLGEGDAVRSQPYWHQSSWQANLTWRDPISMRSAIDSPLNSSFLSRVRANTQPPSPADSPVVGRVDFGQFPSWTSPLSGFRPSAAVNLHGSIDRSTSVCTAVDVGRRAHSGQPSSVVNVDVRNSVPVSAFPPPLLAHLLQGSLGALPGVAASTSSCHMDCPHAAVSRQQPSSGATFDHFSSVPVPVFPPSHLFGPLLQGSLGALPGAASSSCPWHAVPSDADVSRQQPSSGATFDSLNAGMLPVPAASVGIPVDELLNPVYESQHLGSPASMFEMASEMLGQVSSSEASDAIASLQACATSPPSGIGSCLATWAELSGAVNARAARQQNGNRPGSGRQPVFNS